MSAGDLASLSDVRAWLRVTGTTDDTMLGRLITAVSKRIESYCSRTFAQASYVDAYDGKDTLALPFDNFPVTVVSSLAIDGVSIPASPPPTLAGYRFSDTMLSLVGGYRFARGYQNVAVAYTAGFAATPADVAQACIELVAIRYREIDRIGQISKQVGGETISFFKGDMPDSVKGLLQPYVRVVPR